MATLGEFGSLLQLGFGVGAGLTLFRAPVDLRTAKLRQTIEGYLGALAGVNSAAARERFAQLATLRLKLHDETNNLERILFPVLVMTAAGAVLNWILLMLASINAGRVVTEGEQCWLIFFAAVYFMLIGIVLEVVARIRLRSIQAELRSVLQLSI